MTGTSEEPSNISSLSRRNGTSSTDSNIHLLTPTLPDTFSFAPSSAIGDFIPSGQREASQDGAHQHQVLSCGARRKLSEQEAALAYTANRLSDLATQLWETRDALKVAGAELTSTQLRNQDLAQENERLRRERDEEVSGRKDAERRIKEVVASSDAVKGALQTASRLVDQLARDEEVVKEKVMIAERKAEAAAEREKELLSRLIQAEAEVLIAKSAEKGARTEVARARQQLGMLLECSSLSDTAALRRHLLEVKMELATARVAKQDSERQAEMAERLAAERDATIDGLRGTVELLERDLTLSNTRNAVLNRECETQLAEAEMQLNTISQLTVEVEELKEALSHVSKEDPRYDDESQTFKAETTGTNGGERERGWRAVLYVLWPAGLTPSGGSRSLLQMLWSSKLLDALCDMSIQASIAALSPFRRRVANGAMASPQYGGW